MNKYLPKMTLLACCLVSIASCQSRGATPAGISSQQTFVRSQTIRPQVVKSQAQRMFSLDELRQKIAEGVFQNLDTNKNNVLELTEYSSRYQTLKDINNNGGIDLSEFVQQKETILLERFSVAKMRAAFKASFTKKDLNKDGFVSFQEDRNVNMIFDYNGDQKFSYSEFEDAISQIFTLVPSKIQEWVNAHQV